MTALVINFFTAPAAAPAAAAAVTPTDAGHCAPRNYRLPVLLALAGMAGASVATELLFGHVPLRPLAAVGLLVFGNVWLAANGGAAEAASSVADAGLAWMV
jgi:hypothetical protein